MTLRTRRRWLVASSLLLCTLLTATSAAATPLPDDDDDDDEFDAVVWISDVEVNEDEGSATFTVFKTGRTKTQVSVDVYTVDGTATANTDYIETSATVTLPRRRNATKTFVVPIVDDAIDEQKETFFAVLSNPVGVAIRKEAGVATIRDNDRAGVVVDVGDGLYVLEGDQPDTFSIRLQSAPAAPVTVAVVTDDAQLSLSPATITVDAKNWTQAHEVVVTAVEDGLDEDDPHFAEIDVELQSADSNYDRMELKPIPVTIGDADALLVSIIGPHAGAPQQTATFEAVVNAGERATSPTTGRPSMPETQWPTAPSRHSSSLRRIPDRT